MIYTCITNAMIGTTQRRISICILKIFCMWRSFSEMMYVLDLKVQFPTVGIGGNEAIYIYTSETSSYKKKTLSNIKKKTSSYNTTQQNVTTINTSMYIYIYILHINI